MTSEWVAEQVASQRAVLAQEMARMHARAERSAAAHNALSAMLSECHTDDDLDSLADRLWDQVLS